MPKDEGQTTTAVLDQGATEEEMADMAVQIDESVTAAIEEIEREQNAENFAEEGDSDTSTDPAPKVDEEAEGDNVPDSEEGLSDEDEDNGQEDDEGPSPDTISDESLERAVRAGLSMADAKKFPDEATLANVCEKLEATHEDGQSEDEGVKDDESTGTEDLLAKIPDLDPEEYDETLVAVVGTLKDLARQQQETINDLRTAAEESRQGQAQTWFETKVSSMSKSMQNALKKDPSKRASLEEQFDVLEAGYKATSKDVARDTIFDQAVAASLSDVKAEADKKSRDDQIRGRKGQFVARPSTSHVKDAGDPFEMTVAEVEKKFNEMNG